MRADLLEAQAAVDWPSAQLLSLDARLDEWLKANVAIEVRRSPPPAEVDRIVLVERNLLPLTFSAEVGGYINSIRSSLDILAMALLRRHDIEIHDQRDVQFPICEGEKAFQKSKGWKLLQRLPERERSLIEALKPYPEGNPALWALHHLDIVRKHRRLLDVRIHPIHVSLQGALKPGDFTPLPTGVIHVNEETVVGLLRKGVPEPTIRSWVYVAMSEDGYVQRKPVLATLIMLAEVATDVIRRFDAA